MTNLPTTGSDRYAGAAVGWQGLSVLALPYSAATPIATCHWQWIANILSTDGFANAWESLGLSWGCREVGPVLFGLASWPKLLTQISGAEVEIRVYASADAACRDELAFSARGLPFVVEVDSYYLATACGEHDHVVHAVLVVERNREQVRLVDDRAGPEISRYAATDYDRMRANPCDGRVEPHKLYVVRTPPTRQASPSEIFQCIIEHLRETHEQSLETLERYVSRAADTGAAINVCRAAGERFQAARTFEFLAAQGIPGTRRPAAMLADLSNNWYLAHMLASHPSGESDRVRRRLVRIMRHVLAAEHNLVEVLMV
jgi:hypothetical protein